MNSPPPSAVQIRVFEVSDQERLVQLWHDCDLTRPWNNPEDDIRQCLENPSSELLVAAAEDTLCGSVMIGCDGHRGWVYYLAVEPIF